jgi:hypothetical protein
LESTNVSQLYCHCETCCESYIIQPEDDIPSDFAVKTIDVSVYDGVISEEGVETCFYSSCSGVSFVN